MIFVDLCKLTLPAGWQDTARQLTDELKAKAEPEERRRYIEKNRAQTWGSRDLVAALRTLVGDKCWYTEAPLVGADPNVDHFRPKNRVREIDEVDKSHSGGCAEGYWWLAFEYRNYRLSSQHANQRRVDEIGGTDGGKLDYFPVDGERCAAVTDYDLIQEQILALDPCSPTDTAMLRFTPEGKPTVRTRKGTADPWEERRVKMSIWLYHLDKSELVTARKRRMAELDQVLKATDICYRNYRNWDGRHSPSKTYLDNQIATIKGYLKDDAPYAGACRSMLNLRKFEYEWIDDYL